MNSILIRKKCLVAQPELVISIEFPIIEDKLNVLNIIKHINNFKISKRMSSKM